MPSSDEDEEPAEAYEVEKILKDRRYKGKPQYLIHWKGYGSSDDEWVPEANMACPDLLKAFKDRKKRLNSKKKPAKTNLRTPTSTKQKKKMSVNRTVNTSVSTPTSSSVPDDSHSDGINDEEKSLVSLTSKNKTDRRIKRKHSEKKLDERRSVSVEQPLPLSQNTKNEVPRDNNSSSSETSGQSYIPLAKRRKVDASEQIGELGNEPHNRSSCEKDDVLENIEILENTENGDQKSQSGTNNEAGVEEVLTNEGAEEVIISVASDSEHIISDESISPSKDNQILSEFLKETFLSEDDIDNNISLEEITIRSHLIRLKQMEIRNAENRTPGVEEDKDYYALGYKAESIMHHIDRPTQKGEVKQYALVKFADVSAAELVQMDYVREKDPELVEDYLLKITTKASINEKK